jgi:sulfopyruvate decarboxylase alpha subunit
MCLSHSAAAFCSVSSGLSVASSVTFAGEGERAGQLCAHGAMGAGVQAGGAPACAMLHPAGAPADTPAADWPALVHAALAKAGVSMVAHVPDAGHKRLIEACQRDPSLRTIPLTSEEEGVGLAAGGWLGGARTVLLMQSSGVGNLPNALAMTRECRFPLVLIVTMRGEEGEANPWQMPMGQAAATLLSAMGVDVLRADTPEDVAPVVRSALQRAFEGGSAVAVLIAQRVVGVKKFAEARR